MKILERMLKNFIDVPSNIFELTNQKIIEVESFGKLNDATNLVIGHVLTCEDHPNSDHLHLTTVDLGDRVEQIVCGASNVSKDQYVIVAQVGAILPGNFEIKASKIRGEYSNGMICSLKELGFEDKMIPEIFKDGIYVFDEEKEIGKPALEVLGLEGWVMELGLTPNRGDLLSILGFAEDVASMTNQKVKSRTFKISESEKENPIKVMVETKHCTAYHARAFENITIKESPWWLKNALIAEDIKPMNNVVDISNYVMIEYGTPLHMFDLDKLESKKIVVRHAEDQEKVKTLDGIDRVLESKDVLITDGKKPIAIGGVMGLENSMIDEKTTKVVLEAARFDPKSIQMTSKRLNLKSDSSLRFERGVAQNRVLLGLERATELLIELADAIPLKGISTCIKEEQTPAAITIKKHEIQNVLGIELSETELFEYFDRYRYTYKVLNDIYVIHPPLDRPDLVIPADIIEEIARMYGLDQIPMKEIVSPMAGRLSEKQKRLRSIRHHLASLGFHEIITYSLIEPSRVHDFQNLGDPVSVIMPLSEDKKTLRQSLVHGLLDVISYNQNRQKEDVAIFEIGNTFTSKHEDLYLSIGMSGAWLKNPWNKLQLKPDYFLLKGILEHVFRPLGIEFSYESTDEIKSYHPYRQAKIIYDKEMIGYIAEIHPSTQKALDISKTYVLELNLSKVIKHKETLNYQAPSRFPSVTRDLAILVDENLNADEIIQIIKQTARKQLVDLFVFDIYQGNGIEKGLKSIAFSLTFNDPNQTLKTEDVDQLMKKIIGRLTFQFKAVLRS